MKKLKKRGIIEYGLLSWFLIFCLMVVLAITSEIKAKPVYLTPAGSPVPIVTGIEIEQNVQVEKV